MPLLLGLLLFGGAAGALAAVEEAVLAGGCFWCLEHDLEVLPGVLAVESGYTGGHLDHPSYRQVSSETTGHQEAVRVEFDPARISYAQILRSYWRNVDPLDGEGQFCDRGDSYRAVIFTAGEEQAEIARDSARLAAAELVKPLSTLAVQIRPLSRFWPAEGYHQDFAERNSIKYNFYRFSCGRDRRLDEIWDVKARSGEDWLH
ncbi:MAG: peptide-methionine (S)-S-oxide reductase MsrA [Prochlorococcus sp.]|nr:peptide-methionine (S)-S-oxide reductase MsrA [Prochlorococcaceae cyanobacterium Fu_MAG_50]